MKTYFSEIRYIIFIEVIMKDLTRIQEHLQQHPNDYQTAISYLKNRSKQFDIERKHKQDKMRKDIAMYKRRLKNAEQTFE